MFLDPYGKEARIGLVRTMVARCGQFDETCEEIPDQLDFIRAMSFLTDCELERLDDELDFATLLI